jgi:tetratricopeptide (TPR) repeat protein
MNKYEKMMTNNLNNKEKNEKIFNPLKVKTSNASYEHTGRRFCRLPYAYIVQNIRLIWLDTNIDEINNDDCHNTITKLRSIVNVINIFTDVDECINFLMEIKDEKIFMIISDALSQHILSFVKDLSQVECIYIFCQDKSKYEQCFQQQWQKLKGIFTEISSICKILQQTIQQFDQDSISISFLPTRDEIDTSNQNLNQLNQSYMYTQILKDILLTIDFDQSHIKDFIAYYREQFDKDDGQQDVIDILEQNYYNHTPVWWYTYNSFFCAMLNRALRTMDISFIIKMGFYVRDLHRHIEQLHLEQFVGCQQTEQFIVYRGQGFSSADFDRLMKMKGGLVSFNNFLSTSVDRDIALTFAQSNQQNSNLISVLFEITVNPSVRSTPFAYINEISNYKTENEFLFSMHTIFRIEEIKQINENDRFWHVKLVLSGDDDPELSSLAKQMQREIPLTTNGWHRLGQLLIKLGQFNKAEQIYKLMLDKTSNDEEKSMIYHMYGIIKNGEGEYKEAITFYEKSIEILEKIALLNNPYIAVSCSKIGSTYDTMGEYSTALSFHEKSLKILQQTLPSNHPYLAISFNDIGSTYNKMKKYSKALSYHEQALKILQQTLPPNYPSLATCYSNIGSVYKRLNEHSKALSSYEKSIEIRKRSLPSYHPDVVISYHEIGSIYDEKGELTQALSFYEKAFKIQEKSLPSDHPNLASTYALIGSVYNKMGEYSKALSFYENALKIHKKNQSPNHPNLAISYDNIGEVYYKMDELSKALKSHEKALEIFQKTLSSNHPDLAISLNNMGTVYLKMNEYMKALCFFENALAIYREILPPNHPNLAIFYDNIGVVYFKIKEYSKTLSYNTKAIEIFEVLDSHYPDLAMAYNNAGGAYLEMGDYSKAVLYCERAVDIGQRSLPPDHPDLRLYKMMLASLRSKQ